MSSNICPNFVHHDSGKYLYMALYIDITEISSAFLLNKNVHCSSIFSDISNRLRLDTGSVNPISSLHSFVDDWKSITLSAHFEKL